MSMNKISVIVLTGGGSAGHVLPNIPIAECFSERGYEVHYLGSRQGIERSILASSGLIYHAVSVAKLRRYASVQSLLIPFQLIAGVIQAIFVLRRIKPVATFSKGGFVSFPCVLASFLLRIPIVLHESDRTSGLANRICAPFAKKICTALPLTWMLDPIHEKHVFTGIPFLFDNSDASDSALKNMVDEENYILVFGGSQGASSINDWIWDNINALTEYRNVIHIVGEHKLNPKFPTTSKYIQVEFVSAGFHKMISNARIVICRAGMNTLFELIHLNKSGILIPLPAAASRGDQIENAALMREKGLFRVLDQEHLPISDPVKIIKQTLDNEKDHLDVMLSTEIISSPEILVDIIIGEIRS